jgi:hypothetical protein
MTAAHPSVITDDASRSALLSTHLIRGEQCAEARLGQWSDTKQLPGRCRGYGRAGSLAIAELALVAQPQTPAPQEGARRVPVDRLVVVAIEDVRTPSVPFVRCLSASLPVRHGVPGGVDGVRPDRPDMRCPEGCPIVASTVDAGHDRADIGRDQACGRSGIEHGRRWPRRTGPGAGSGWGWPKGACALPSCPVRARTRTPRGWRGRLAIGMVGRTLGAGGVRRLPPPSGPGPDPSAGRSP